jgi:hypothetical protein
MKKIPLEKSNNQYGNEDEKNQNLLKKLFCCDRICQRDMVG